MALEENFKTPRPFSVYALPEAWGTQSVSWHHYVPLLGIFVLLVCGGQVWAQGLFVLCVGVTLWRKPPRYALNRQFDIFAALSVLIVVLTFLPYFIYRAIPLRWLNQGRWRGQLGQLDISVPFTYTPQPLLTLEALFLLMAVLSAIALLIHAPLYPAQRWRYALASAPVLAVLGVLGLLGGATGSESGPLVPALSWAYFPNFGTAMAIGSVLSFALLISALGNRWVLGIAITVLCLAGCGTALALSGSGLWSWTVLAAGLWLVLLLVRTRRVSNLRRAGAIFLLLTGTVLVIAAHIDGLSWVFSREPMAQRVLRYYDTATVTMQQSAMGVGVGNFKYIFPFYQKRSLEQGVTETPGNDWLWVAAESGVVGLSVLALLLCAILIAGIGKSGRRSTAIRQAALCALLVFAVGSVNETPGHYLGTVMLALLCLQIARVRTDKRRRTLLPGWAWKAQAAVLVLVGLLWLSASLLNRPWQSTLATDISSQRIAEALEQRDRDAVNTAAATGLRFTPLNADAYQERGRAAIAISRDLAPGKKDFERAMGLQPMQAEVPYLQGVVWLPFSVQEAETSFRQALQRHSDHPEVLYENIVRETAGDTYFQASLVRLSQINARMRFAYMTGVQLQQFTAALTAELREDADLKRFTEPERRQIIERWVRQGNATSAIRYIQEHPEAIADPWYLNAIGLARLGRHKEAAELMQTSLPMAQIPSLLAPRKQKDQLPLAGFELPKPAETGAPQPARTEANGRLSHLSAASLLQSQLDAQQWSDALATANRLMTEANPPAYSVYWCAWLHNQAGQFDKAWPLWEKYSRYYLERRWERLAAQQRGIAQNMPLSAQAFERWGNLADDSEDGH